MNGGLFNGTGLMQPFSAPAGVRTLAKKSTDPKGSVISFEDGQSQELLVIGSTVLSTEKVPRGEVTAVLLRVVNGGSGTFTSSGITWLKSDNTQTSVFSNLGIALQVTGNNLIMLLGYGDGTVYGKVA